MCIALAEPGQCALQADRVRQIVVWDLALGARHRACDRISHGAHRRRRSARRSWRRRRRRCRYDVAQDDRAMRPRAMQCMKLDAELARTLARGRRAAHPIGGTLRCGHGQRGRHRRPRGQRRRHGRCSHGTYGGLRGGRRGVPCDRAQPRERRSDGLRASLVDPYLVGAGLRTRMQRPTIASSTSDWNRCASRRRPSCACSSPSSTAPLPVNQHSRLTWSRGRCWRPLCVWPLSYARAGRFPRTSRRGR